MKKIVAIAMVLLAGIMVSNAQAKREDKQVTKIMNNLQQACQLTPDQATKIQPMAESFVNTRMANRQKYAGDKASLKTANQTNRQNFKANLATVLSADQIKQYEAYVKQQDQQKRAGGAGRSGGEGDDGGQQ